MSNPRGWPEQNTDGSSSDSKSAQLMDIPGTFGGGVPRILPHNRHCLRGVSMEVFRIRRIGTSGYRDCACDSSLHRKRPGRPPHHKRYAQQYISTQTAHSATIDYDLCIFVSLSKSQVCNNELRSSPHTQGPHRPGVLEGRPRTRTLCQGTGHGDPGDARWYTDRGVRRR